MPQVSLSRGFTRERIRRVRGKRWLKEQARKVKAGFVAGETIVALKRNRAAS